MTQHVPHFVLVSVHPRFISAYFEFGVFRAALTSGGARIDAVDLRDFAVDAHASVDAAPYGGGDGMVLRPEPLRDAIAKWPGAHVVTTGPAGRKFTHVDAARLAAMTKPIVVVCGRFGGIDQRFLDRHVHEEFSIGDVVLSGGELPGLAIVDASLRLLPGVLGHPDSASADSFGTGCDGLLEGPLYTRPPEFEGMRVPDVLMSGDHALIHAWRKAASLERTARLRPDLLPGNDSRRKS